MTEAQVGFLYKIAAALSQNDSNLVLRSYYLMRCKDLTRGYGLPEKYFSSKIRCPNCCMEWSKNTTINVKSIKLSKRQKQRLKSKKITQYRKESVRHRKDLQLCNEIEQVCTFCKKSTITPVRKPQKILEHLGNDRKTQFEVIEDIKTQNIQKSNRKNIDTKPHKEKEINVYANASNVFSLQNKNNTLASSIKKEPKVISNNKKKKDKFAGLCQKAVLASAKHKEQKNKQNKLNLFLKPSS